MPWLATACWKTCALPSKLVAMVGGRPTSAATAWMSFTASPSATPGARLNETMTAGSCEMWLTVSEVGLSERLATVSSGTRPPVGVRTIMRRSTSLVSAYFGSTSRITW